MRHVMTKSTFPQRGKSGRSSPKSHRLAKCMFCSATQSPLFCNFRTEYRKRIRICCADGSTIMSVMLRHFVSRPDAKLKRKDERRTLIFFMSMNLSTGHQLSLPASSTYLKMVPVGLCRLVFHSVSLHSPTEHLQLAVVNTCCGKWWSRQCAYPFCPLTRPGLSLHSGRSKSATGLW